VAALTGEEPEDGDERVDPKTSHQEGQGKPHQARPEARWKRDQEQDVASTTVITSIR
jgi:hypothetical protein